MEKETSGQPVGPRDNPAARKLLALLTRCNEEHEGHLHRLCSFCWHNGKPSCPFGGTGRTGMCYEFQEVAPSLDEQVVQYLCAPPHGAQSETRLAA